MLEVNGYLEIFPKGFGFLRKIENNFKAEKNNVYVPGAFIREMKLKEGLFIEGIAEVKESYNNKSAQLIKIKNINRQPVKNYKDVKELKDQTSINPCRRISLSLGKNDRMGRILNLIAPFGKGQRALIVSPPKTGKTTILKHIALALSKNHPEMKIFVLLVDERPEEVTDFRRSLESAYVLSSSADESVSSHLRITRLVMNSAIRETEFGNDAVILIDSLTRMGRAFNRETESYSKTLTGGLGANALELPRRFFGAARNIENGGSLTIAATILVDTGSRMDAIIFQEFKGTGNLDLVLSKACAERRIFPAININETGTRKEHLLLDDDEFREAAKLRRMLASMDEAKAMAYFIEYLDRSL